MFVTAFVGDYGWHVSRSSSPSSSWPRRRPTFLQQVFIARVLGATEQTDGYQIALAIVLFLLQGVIMGALVNAFVPHLARLTREDPGGARHYSFWAQLNMFVAASFGTILLWIVAPDVVGWSTAGLSPTARFWAVEAPPHHGCRNSARGRQWCVRIRPVRVRGPEVRCCRPARPEHHRCVVLSRRIHRHWLCCIADLAGARCGRGVPCAARATSRTLPRTETATGVPPVGFRCEGESVKSPEQRKARNGRT